MEKWTAKEVKEKGNLLLKKLVEFFNDKITKEEYGTILKEIFETSKLSKCVKNKENLAIKKYNDAQMQKYIDVANILQDLVSMIYKEKDNLTIENNTIIRILDMVITSETKIEGDIEYNRLLEAIPKEVLKQMDKELTKPKDIEKDRNNLVSIDFLMGDFSTSFIPLFYTPTMNYAKIDFCLLLTDIILSYYDIETKIELESGEGNESYKDARNNISKILLFAEREPKFKKTQVYNTMTKYKNLFDVRDSKEYKEARKELVKTIIQMLKDKKTANDMINECISKLFKQGWWFNEKNSKK